MEPNFKYEPFDIHKVRSGVTVCTRDGKPARVICTNKKSNHDEYPVVALVDADEGHELVLCYTSEGYCAGADSPEYSLNLVFPIEKTLKGGWMNVFINGANSYTGSVILPNKEQAESVARGNPSYIATIPVTFPVKP